MPNKTRVIVLSLFCVLSIPPGAAASGFALFSQAARAAGMANAFVARASDPSAVWYNPAGLSKLDGFQVYVGGNLVSTGKRQYYSVYRDRTLTADSLSSILPNVFVSYKLTNRIGLGLGIYSPYNYEIT